MKSLVLIVLLSVATIAAAEPTLYKIMSGKPSTFVEFKSEAPLETVTGQTHTVTGYIELDNGTGHSEIHVDLASLKTGIPLRDKEMRENHLETDRYPEAVFVTGDLTLPPEGLMEGVRTRVAVRGNFSLHGVTREITPDAYLTLSPNSVRIESNFVITLADYNISRQLLRLRLAEEQQITVDITAVNESRGETTHKAQ